MVFEQNNCLIMLKIYDELPEKWEDLQNQVAKIFLDLGFETTVEKDITTVRGVVNVDVFAYKMNLTTKEIHIAECKHWGTAVPQQIVHGFRTVVADYGANAGYIISSKGFQTGAYKAAENSNVSLLSFDEFQAEFRTRWLNAVVDDLELLGYPLRKYTDPMEDFYNNAFVALDEIGKVKFCELQKQYMHISLLSFRGLYKNMMSGQLEIEYIDDDVLRYAKDFPKEVSVKCLIDYFEYLKALCKKGVAEFDAIFGKKLRKHGAQDL